MERGKNLLYSMQDKHGNPLPQSCSKFKADAMIARGDAVLVKNAEKPTIRLLKPWSPKGMFYR